MSSHFFSQKRQHSNLLLTAFEKINSTTWEYFRSLPFSWFELQLLTNWNLAFGIFAAKNINLFSQRRIREIPLMLSIVKILSFSIIKILWIQNVDVVGWIVCYEAAVKSLLLETRITDCDSGKCFLNKIILLWQLLFERLLASSSPAFALFATSALECFWQNFQSTF